MLSTDHTGAHQILTAVPQKMDYTICSAPVASARPYTPLRTVHARPHHPPPTNPPDKLLTLTPSPTPTTSHHPLSTAYPQLGVAAFFAISFFVAVAVYMPFKDEHVDWLNFFAQVCLVVTI